MRSSRRRPRRRRGRRRRRQRRDRGAAHGRPAQRPRGRVRPARDASARPHRALRARRPRGLRGVRRRPQRRGGRRLVSPPRRALAPGGRDARARARRRFGAPEALSAFVRLPCCTSVSVAIGARGDAVATWSSTARPAVWAALRAAGQRFGAPRLLARDASDAPRVVVGEGGAVALTYSTQHVPLRAADGLQLHRAPRAGAFGPAEHVNPGGGVTIAGAAVTAAGRVLLAWRDQVHGARVHLSEAAPGAAAGRHGRARRRRERRSTSSVAADDDGRASSRGRSGSRRACASRPSPRCARRAARRSPPPSRWGRRGRGRGRASRGWCARGGALVAWNAARFGRPAQRRSALLVTRLP